jgi:signal transduction histidine kinase
MGGSVALLLAFLVGWILIWANDEAGPNAVWLTLGPVGFSAVTLLIAAQYWSLRRSSRLRRTESAFLTGASHNLRTPLAAIRAGLQTLATAGEKLENQDKVRLYEAILHESERLERRIDNLIETARLDLEQRPYDRRVFDLSELVREVFDDLRWAFVARGGTFKLPPSPEPVLVSGDRRALKLLIENLVDNALKFSDLPPEVVTSCENRHGRALVTVTDHGVGFEAETQVFGPHRGGDSQRKGFGIGLRLARTIARGHGGDVTLRSPGRGLGATAELSLPLADD